MKINEIIEVLCALHLGARVDGPFPARGGIMVVGNPGVLKSSLLSILESNYPDALMLSDVNVQTLSQYRNAMTSGRVKSLVLPELAKIYERNPATASHIEGTLRALADEGFRAASFEDARIQRITAKCAIMGAMTPSMQQRHFNDWNDSGFSRRFLWSLISLSDESLLESAVVQWQRIDFRVPIIPRPPVDGSRIPMLSTEVERRHLTKFLKHQPGDSRVVQLATLAKAHAVLKWWYKLRGEDKDPMETIESFGESLGNYGASIEIESPVDLNGKPTKPKIRAKRKSTK